MSPQYIGAVALLASFLAASSNVNAMEYARLVPAVAPLPRTSPVSASAGTARAALVFQLISETAPWANEDKVRSELQGRFDARLKEGLGLAERLGQQGALLKIQLISQPTAVGTSFYSLRGEGVDLIGVGADPDKVCFAAKCYLSYQPKLTPAQGLTEDSGYVWVERKNNGLDVSRYRIDQLEQRAAQLQLSANTRTAYAASVRSEALSGYAHQLTRAIRLREDQEEVAKLIASRDEALREVKKIEEELAKQLRRAKRAARNAAQLEMMANVFSFGSTIAMMNTSLGEDVTQTLPGGVSNEANLRQALSLIGTDAGNKVQELEVRLNTTRNNITGWEIRILEIGVKYEMKPPAGSVLSPLP